MKILVTGASGELGREVVAQLRSAHEVVGLDVCPSPTADVPGSTTDRALVEALVSQVDAVVHTAALHAPHVPTHSAEQFLDVNARGTLYVLEAAARCGLRRVVCTSSTSVYGHALHAAHEAVWITEDVTPQPRDIYDVTKRTAEMLAEHYAATAGLPTTVLRVGRFFAAEPAPLRAAYRMYRGLDVRDAARAHVLALENNPPHFGLYNIAAASAFERADCPELLTNAPAVVARRYPQAAAEFQRRGWALPARIDRVYRIERAQAELGYQPAYNLPELLVEA